MNEQYSKVLAIMLANTLSLDDVDFRELTKRNTYKYTVSLKVLEVDIKTEG